jgi:Putative adhesin
MTHLPRILASACFAAAFTASASAKIDREVEKTFQVAPGTHLKVSTMGGNITVSSAGDTVAKIVAKEHIHASSEAEADDMLKKLDLTIEQHGDELVASASYEHGVGLHFGSWPPVQVDFVITVPSSASAELKTSGGDVIVDDLAGPVNARTSGGDIKLGTIGGDVDASTSGGNVGLVEGRGKVRLETSGGNISAKRLVGPSDLKTSGGDIKIESVENTITAETSGGDVRATFDGTIKGDCKLSTSGGQVRAAVSKAAAFHLEAGTSGGEVDASGLTITIDHGGSGKSSLSGSVNGGGPELKLRSSGGDIEINTR